VLTTIAALKAELDIADTASDAALTTLIRQQSAAVERYCNRSFGLRGVTDRRRLNRSAPCLILSVLPVVAVTSVTVDGAELDEDAYEIADAENGDEGSGLLYRSGDNDRRIPWAAGKIVVAYQAGYVLPGVTGYDLPADVERACLDLCVRAWAARGRDPTLRGYENPDVERFTYTATDSIDLRRGLPLPVAGLLDPYRMLAV
jgi:uncharacterized phiE125 gp8 family phage protein